MNENGIIIVKHNGCTARVRLRNFSDSVKERFNTTLARELMRCYSTKEAAQHDRISTSH
jgi:hypothetical protein